MATMPSDRIETKLMAVLDGEDLVIRGIKTAVADAHYPMDLAEVFDSDKWRRVYWCVDFLDDSYVVWSISDPDIEFFIEDSFLTVHEAMDHAEARARSVGQLRLEWMHYQAVQAGFPAIQAHLERLMRGEK